MAILVNVVALLCASPRAFGQGGDGYVGVFGDAAGTIRCMQAPPGVPTTLYVVAKTGGATANGITGAEFRIELLNPSGYILNYTPAIGATTIGTPLDPSGCNTAFSTCQAPSGGNIALGTMFVFNTGTGSPTEIIVRRRNPPLNSDYPCALFVQCDAQFSLSCMTAPPDSTSCLSQKTGTHTSSADEISTSLNVTGIGEILETVSGGIVYGYGIRFSEPYRFSVLGDTLFLNDVPYQPSRNVAPLDLAPVTPRIQSKSALIERALSAARGQSDRDAQFANMRTALDGDSLVVSIRSTDEGLWVRFTGETSEELLTVDLLEMFPTPMAELHRQAIEEFTLAAARGMHIAFGDGYRILTPRSWIPQSQELIDQIMTGGQIDATQAQSTALWQNTRFVEDLYRQRARILGR